MNQIDDDDYKSLVIAECKGEDGDYAALFADITRWRDMLTTLIEEVEEQFELKRSDLANEKVEIFDTDDRDEAQIDWMEAKAKFDTWAAKANSYKRHLMARKRDIVRMLKEDNKVNDAIEHARRNVLTVVGDFVNLPTTPEELQAAWDQYQTAVQMKGEQ